MSETTSTMLPLGTIAPDFNLPDTITGKHFNLQELKGDQGTLVLFICNHCPYVLHVKDQLIAIATHYKAKGIGTITISSNDIKHYPQDAPDKMKALMEAWGQPFSAYLYDETQQIAKAYQTACTPDIYLFDAKLACIYRGRLDGATPQNNVPVTGEELRNALENLLAKKPIDSKQIPSMGCNIKWKKS
jgi:thiol-disulfide isomerase/thioredoxin